MSSSKTSPFAPYRAYQFFVALRAYLPAWAGGVRGELTQTDRHLVKSILATAPQQRLFARMAPNDQRHALAVARTLHQARFSQPALLQAALLHDVAKCLGQPIIHRVLIVLLEAFWPTALIWLSSAAPNQPLEQISRWRRPFAVHAHHPALGAAWAAEADCDPLAVRLIARHQESLDQAVGEEGELLVMLQWADNLN